MFNPILAHRQEVSERILKGFGANEIEKAQYVHKYIQKQFSKTGKIRYLYETTKNLKRIMGEKNVKKKNNKEVAENTLNIYIKNDTPSCINIDVVSLQYYNNFLSTSSS